MSTVTFDTLKFVERLEKAGVPRAQATAMVEAQKESLAEVMDASVATRADLAATKAELKADIAKLAASNKEDYAKLDKEMAVLKWMMGLLMAGVGAQLVKLFFA